MVKIKKGNLTAIVPLKTYKNHYEKLGWKIRVNKSKVYQKEDETTETEFIEHGNPDSEVDLNSMNTAALKEYAEQNGIDVSEATTKKEIRAIIEAALDI